jgi:hypothetical protein
VLHLASLAKWNLREHSDDDAKEPRQFGHGTRVAPQRRSCQPGTCARHGTLAPAKGCREIAIENTPRRGWGAMPRRSKAVHITLPRLANPAPARRLPQKRGPSAARHGKRRDGKRRVGRSRRAACHAHGHRPRSLRLQFGGRPRRVTWRWDCGSHWAMSELPVLAAGGAG